MEDRKTAGGRPCGGLSVPALLCVALSVNANSSLGATELSRQVPDEPAVPKLRQERPLVSSTAPNTSRQILRTEHELLAADFTGLVAAATGTSPPKEGSPEESLQMAALRYAQGDFGGAVEAANGVLERVGSGHVAAAAATVAGFALLQRSSLSSSLLSESLERLERALSLTEEAFPLASYGRALALWTMDQPVAAILEAESILAIAPAGDLQNRARRLLCTIKRTTPPEELVLEDGSKVGGEVWDYALTSEQRERLKKEPDALKPPEKLFCPPPLYTVEARKEKVKGTVTLQSVIDRYGCPTSIKVLEGLPSGLTESAVETLRAWVFRPCTYDGVPVPVYYNLGINFRLEAGSPEGEGSEH